MKKQEKTIITIASGIALTALLTFFSIQEKTPFSIQADIISYSYTLNKNNAPTGLSDSYSDLAHVNVPTQPLGNAFSLSYASVKEGEGHCVLNNGGSITNDAPLSSWHKLTAVFTGSLVIHYGIEDTTLGEKTLTSGSELTIDPSFSYNYFKVEAKSETALTSLVLTYSCQSLAPYRAVMGGGDYYTYNSTKKTITESGNTAERANGYVRNGVAVGASYSVGFTAQGTQSYPVTERTEVGIVPYYVDDANWILFYVDYSPSERPSGVRVFEVMGFIGGTFVGFNDFWGDNAAYASLASQPSNANALRVDVSTTGTIKSFSFYFNNNIVASKDFDFGANANKTATYGTCIMGDTVTVSDITYTETTTPEKFHWDYRSVALGTASESGGAVTLGNADFQRNFYDTTAAGAAGSYTVTAKMTGTEGYPTTKEVQEGIVPWYVNDGNYLVAYIHWLPSVSSLFEVQLTGAVGWVNVGWNGFAVNSDSAAYVPSAEQTLAITKAGGKFTCSLNGAAVGAEIDLSSHASDAWSAQARVGYYCFNTTATFSGLAVTK